MFRRSASDLSERLTEGPIINSLLRLAWPVMLSNLLQTMYNFVDRFWLARLGKVEIAALAISWPLIFLVLSLGAGVTVAGTALVAQYTGARRFEEANLAAGQVLAFTGIIAIVLAAAGFFAARPILSIMGAEPALTDAATGYLRVIYAGIPLMFGTFIVTALLNGVGDTITPMILMAVSVGVNLILDPFFIFGWGPFPAWGVIGAAVATVLSRGLLALIGFTLLFTGRLGIHIRPRHLKLRWEIVRRIISIGGLSSIGQTGTAIGFSIMNGALARIGTVVLSAFGIGNAFISIVLMPAMGLGQATATVVGQNLGADRPERARRGAWAGMSLSTVILVLASIVVLIFRTNLIRFFLTDPDVVAVGTQMLLLVSFAFPFMGIIQVVAGVYQGSGHTFYSMFFALFRLWALRVPLVYLLGFTFGMGATGVWWAMFASNFGTAVLSLGFFLSGNWIHRVIKEPPLTGKAGA
ncbi:MATE family efflux transporter [Candidatus Acetothermia bacterium]|nr:MAG: MATE family efflux transporter [Candidatus Acetothermia bacterium]HHK67275.1 MATE family efflux transporter [Candidatus Acetothermia bacterium]